MRGGERGWRGDGSDEDMLCSDGSETSKTTTWIEVCSCTCS